MNPTPQNPNTNPQPSPYGYGAPTPPPAGYGVPAPAPTGYGAPPPQPAPPAPPVPPAQNYGGGQPPYGGANYGSMPPPPPKKKKTGLIIAICAIIIAVAGIAVALIFLLGGGKAKEEYNTLAQSIYKLDTPAEVAAKSDELDEFNKANPNIAEKDLLELVKACYEYNDSDENYEDTYTDMLDSLEDLSGSDIDEVAELADTLTEEVERDYEDYQAYIAPPPPLPDNPPDDGGDDIGDFTPGSPSGFELQEYPIYDYDLWADLSPALEDSGLPGYSFMYENIYSSTLRYVEVALFCYDAYGNPIIGEDGYNFEVATDRPDLPAGGIHTPDENGYWEFENCTGVENAIPVIIYAEFEDGNYYGMYSDYYNDYLDLLLEMGAFWDEYAAEELG